MLLRDETNMETRKLTNRVRTGHQSNEQATNARHTCHHGNQNNAMGATPRVAKTGSASHSSERRRISLEDSSSVNVMPDTLCSMRVVWRFSGNSDVIRVKSHHSLKSSACSCVSIRLPASL